jgi:hypothetical protein
MLDKYTSRLVAPLKFIYSSIQVSDKKQIRYEKDQICDKDIFNFICRAISTKRQK